MNCEQAHPLLPLRLHGDLSEGESRELSAHLQTCLQCQADWQSLQSLGSMLHALPMPEVRIDLSAIVQQSAYSQVQSLRRWKRLTAIAAVLAASLLAVLWVRPEVRLDEGALVIRWQPEPAKSVPVSDPDPVLLERLDILAQLVKTLADESDTQNRDRAQQIESLRQRLELVQGQGDGRWEDIQRDMGALYRAQFARKEGTE